MANETKSVDMGIRVNPRKGMLVIPVRLSEFDDMVDQNVFIADQAYRVVSIEEVHTTLGTNGSAVNVMVTRCQGTETPTQGDDLLTAVLDLKSTINTVVAGTLTATNANRRLAKGDRLALDFTGTQTAVTGLAITILLIPDPERRYWQSIV